MKRRVVVHPGQLFCSGCGYALRAENIGATRKYAHDEANHMVVMCYSDGCPQYGERLAFPLQFIECEVKADV